MVGLLKTFLLSPIMTYSHNIVLLNLKKTFNPSIETKRYVSQSLHKILMAKYNLSKASTAFERK